LTAGAAIGGAAGFRTGRAGFAGALTLVAFFGATARFRALAGFGACTFRLLARAAPFAGAARRAFVRALTVVLALLPFGLGI